MMKFFFRILNRLIYMQPSFSQEGEDRILERFLESKKDGFYIDVGANDPRRFSNSYLFYLKGWKGICIDPNPKMAERFKKTRSRDIFVNLGVASVPAELEYFMYDEDALNTFDAKLTEHRLATTKYKVIDRKKIPVKPLKEILGKLHFSGDVDFMNIDVEGLDLEVLKSNDWSTCRPKLLLVENLKEVDNEIEKFLKEKNYHLIAMTKNTLIFSSVKL